MKFKAICFDLGETLIYYDGVPLNWTKYYKKALEKGFKKINKIATENDYSLCSNILIKYNTRINPREIEYNSEQIFNEIMEIVNLNTFEKELLKNEFYDFFQQKKKSYNDTEEILKEIKENELKTGILTDVPYGMPNKYVIDDIKSFQKYIDIVLTSVDVGYRKPNTSGYKILLKELGVKPNEMVYIGNEEKDIIGANNSGIISVLINRTENILNYGEKYQFRNLKDMWKEIKNIGG